MHWSKGKDHITDCYFCMINLKEISSKNRHHVQYTGVPSTTKPIPYGQDLPIPKPDGNMEYNSDFEPSHMTVEIGDDA